jgi:hypothetical protein
VLTHQLHPTDVLYAMMTTQIVLHVCSAPLMIQGRESIFCHCSQEAWPAAFMRMVPVSFSTADSTPACHRNTCLCCSTAAGC